MSLRKNMEEDTGRNGQSFKMMEEIRSDHVVEFSQVSFDDIPEISKFLLSVWSEGYGPMGSPNLSEDYLQWVLGGPNKCKNLLFGGRINSELVAYQSFLYRTVHYYGKILNAYLNTHLAVSTQIDLRPKLECQFQMLEQHVLLDARSKYYDPNCDLVLAFFEAEKTLKYKGDRILRKCFGITRFDGITFNQFMIVPKKLRNYVKENRMEEDSNLVRGASESDSDELTKLFNEIPEDLHFARMMTEEELSHHFFGDPNHLTSVVETQGKIRAFINYYPMGIIKGSQLSSYIIVEFLFSKDRNLRFMAILLNEALKLAEEMGAKGVVLENATYLELDHCQEIGLTPTFRRITMSLISKSHQIDYLGGFRSDIK
jgi:hypothetical protein